MNLKALKLIIETFRSSGRLVLSTTALHQTAVLLGQFWQNPGPPVSNFGVWTSGPACLGCLAPWSSVSGLYTLAIPHVRPFLPRHRPLGLNTGSLHDVQRSPAKPKPRPLCLTGEGRPLPTEGEVSGICQKDPKGLSWANPPILVSPPEKRNGGPSEEISPDVLGNHPVALVHCCGSTTPHKGPVEEDDGALSSATTWVV